MMLMAKLSQDRKALSGGLWMRIGLIASALILVAAIASAFYRSNTEAPNPAAEAPSSPSPSAVPAAAASKAPNNPAAPLMAPARVLETSFPTLDSKPQRLADYAGKIIVVDIWATWCGPCRVEIPHLVELAKEFKGRGVKVIGLTTEDPAKDSEKVREFAREFKINYPIGFANGEFALHLMQGRDVIPQTYVIGRDGRVHKHFVGFNALTSPPQLRAAVEEAVAAEY
jgi:thiol-disulfide isomerase/thioredoxin